MMNMVEIWKDVSGYEGYYLVSNFGRVRSTDAYRMRNRVLAERIDGDGYNRALLCKCGKQTQYKVHRLVAEAFICKPDGKNIVNHLNSDKRDNRVENLEWCTTRENISHSFVHGSRNRIGKMLSIGDMLAIHGLGMYYTCKEIGYMYNIDKTYVDKILHGKHFKHVIHAEVD